MQGHKAVFSYPPQPEGGGQASEDSKASLPAATSQDKDEEEVDQETELVESPTASAFLKRKRFSEDLGSDNDGEEHNNTAAQKRPGKLQMKRHLPLLLLIQGL
jgi:hypothetical protein